MRALALLLAASAALADVAPRPPPAPRPAECSLDADCTVTTFPGCCGGCCPSEPHAESNATLSAAVKRCAIVDCAAPSCDAVKCAAASPVSQWRAVCRGGRCERVAVPADPEVCSSDADCVVTELRCCPRCCESGPRALTRARLALEQRACATEACARPPCREDCLRQPPAGAFRAQCRQSRCALVATPPPPPPPASVCRRDADCTVIYSGGRTDAACRSSPCGCCPGTTPVAVSVEQAGATPLASAPGGGPPAGKPPFGLSQGHGAAAPQCSPCPSPPPARAVCAAGQCALAPR